MSNELVERLREDFGITEAMATDAEVLACTSGTYARAQIELDMAWEQCVKNIKDAWAKLTAHILE